MTLQILRARDREAQPWKNGGGVTREIAVHPPRADFDSFDWRVSTAVVDASGPFSRFDGVDRTLLLLEGPALRLLIDGAISTTLRPASAPVSFPADVPVEATLPHGRVIDLNVMVRRGRWSEQIERLDFAGDTQIRCQTDASLVLSLDACTLASTAAEEPIEPGDVVQLHPGETADLRSGPDSCRLVVIELSRLV
jgi:environmental stress-induced protein Ves